MGGDEESPPEASTLWFLLASILEIADSAREAEVSNRVSAAAARVMGKLGYCLENTPNDEILDHLSTLPPVGTLDNSLVERALNALADTREFPSSVRAVAIAAGASFRSEEKRLGKLSHFIGDGDHLVRATARGVLLERDIAEPVDRNHLIAALTSRSESSISRRAAVRALVRVTTPVLRRDVSEKVYEILGAGPDHDAAFTVLWALQERTGG